MTYACAECGRRFTHWLSACAGCGSGAIFFYEPAHPNAGTLSRLKKFSEIPARQYPRHSTGFVNLDKILGGGLVDGSVILVTGEPGAGKSTLMLQVLGALVNGGLRGAMIHAEESAEQLAARALYWEIVSRDFLMVPDRQLEKAFDKIRDAKLDVLLADSLQTLVTSACPAPEGSLRQVLACCHALVGFAKKKHCAVIIIGHVTKDGEMSGPQTLKHLVDVTLHLEFSETHDRKREITAIKNRYGPSPYALPLTISAFGFRNDS